MGVPRISNVQKRLHFNSNPPAIKEKGKIQVGIKPVPKRPSDDMPADKGKRGGSCNRSACLRPGALWWNRGSYAFYCTECAWMLNDVNRNDSFCKDAPLCDHIIHGPKVAMGIREYERQRVAETGWVQRTHAYY